MQDRAQPRAPCACDEREVSNSRMGASSPHNSKDPRKKQGDPQSAADASASGSATGAPAGAPTASFFPGGLTARKYHALRAGLFVLACVLIIAAMFMLAFTTSQLSRTQQLATSLIQTEQRAEVLLIASFDDDDSATQLQRDGVIDLLERSSVSVDVEYLDVLSCNTSANATNSLNPNATLETTEYGAKLANSDWGRALTQKIQDHGPYSAVICIDDDALYFTEAVHESLFAQTPVVFVGVSDTAHAQRVFDAGYATGVLETTDAAAMVFAAQKLCSTATHVVVLTDNTATGVGDRAQFQQAVTNPDPAYASITDLPVSYLNASTVSRAELGKEVSELESDTLLIYLGARADASGNAYSASQSAYFIARAAACPVFAVGFGGVGEGFTGSGFVDYEQAGTRAGELTVMILNGTRPADIPLESAPAEGTVFDAQALADAGLATSALPTNAATINQSGLSFDSLRPIFLPVSLLILGIACIIAFAILGYRRTATELASVVTQRNMLERRFYTDTLTDMPNMQWLTVYAGSDQSSQVRAIVEVALPEVEKLNQTRGEGTADEVVKVLATRLSGLDKLFLVRPSHDEFILGVDHELKPGGAILDELEYLLSQPIKLKRGAGVAHETINIEPCVGVYNRERGMSIEEMVSGVDLAIRQAEKVGMSGEIIFYDKDMSRAVEHKLEITQRIKHAIEKDGFIMVYQPQIELATNEVVGYEALVRMRGDYFPPEQFIPVAEANGQIVEIDRIVTKKVVLQLATWKKRKQRMRPISINYSYGQLRDDHYLDYAKALLDEHGVSHDLLRIDIKENLFINNMAKATDFVDELCDAGFAIAIDGFGAGYTSISRVMKIPADVVKIDRSLTATFLAGGDDEVISNLVRLVHSANKIVVIEGVETAAQLRLCRQMGCDVVQGFYFSEPLLPEQAVRYKPFDPTFVPRPASALTDTPASAAPANDAAPAPTNNTPPAPTSESAPANDAPANNTSAAASDPAPAPTSNAIPAPDPTPAGDSPKNNAAPASVNELSVDETSPAPDSAPISANDEAPILDSAPADETPRQLKSADEAPASTPESAPDSEPADDVSTDNTPSDDTPADDPRPAAPIPQPEPQAEPQPEPQSASEPHLGAPAPQSESQPASDTEQTPQTTDDSSPEVTTENASAQPAPTTAAASDPADA